MCSTLHSNFQHSFVNGETIYHLHHISFSSITTTTFLFPSATPPHFFFFPPHHHTSIVSLHHHHMSIVPLNHHHHRQHHHISFVSLASPPPAPAPAPAPVLPHFYRLNIMVMSFICPLPKLQKLPLVGAAVFLKCTAQLIKKLRANNLIWVAIILVEAMENMAYMNSFGQ